MSSRTHAPLPVRLAQAGAWFWAIAPRYLLDPAAPVVTTLGTVLLAVAGTNRIFHGLLDARTLGLLVPLMCAGRATLAASRRP